MKFPVFSLSFSCVTDFSQSFYIKINSWFRLIKASPGLGLECLLYGSAYKLSKHLKSLITWPRLVWSFEIQQREVESCDNSILWGQGARGSDFFCRSRTWYDRRWSFPQVCVCPRGGGGGQGVRGCPQPRQGITGQGVLPIPPGQDRGYSPPTGHDAGGTPHAVKNTFSHFDEHLLLRCLKHVTLSKNFSQIQNLLGKFGWYLQWISCTNTFEY